MQSSATEHLVQPSRQNNESNLNRRRVALILFWVGVLVAVMFAVISTPSLMNNLRTMTIEQNNATIWADDGALWIFWALSVTIGSILAGTGAFVYVKTKPIFVWLTGIGVLAAVIAMVMVWSRVYNARLFGIGGAIILVSFFAIVWFWMKTVATLDSQAKVAASFKLIGYIFWINTSWFLCGESAKMHLKAYADGAPPVPTEILVFLVLGWLFVLIGEYQTMRLTKRGIS